METKNFTFYTWQAVECTWDDDNLVNVPQILCRLSFTATLALHTYHALREAGDDAMYKLADMAMGCEWDDDEFGVSLHPASEGVVDNAEDEFGFFEEGSGVWHDIADAEHMFGVDLDGLDFLQAAGGQYGAEWGEGPK